MSQISPFRALRPAPDAAAEVAAVPYDVVTTEEARAIAVHKPSKAYQIADSHALLTARLNIVWAGLRAFREVLSWGGDGTSRYNTLVWMKDAVDDLLDGKKIELPPRTF